MIKKTKLVCGVGINDADYPVYRTHMEGGRQVVDWKCPFYEKWGSMLKRCYSEKQLKRGSSYRGCTVCDDWLNFSNFRDWMEQQDWGGKQLDKDLLVEGSKVYSPDTCIFISSSLNLFLLTRNGRRGSLPLGVSTVTNYTSKYQSSIKVNSKSTHLGTFDTQEEAHLAWQRAKLSIAKDYLAEETDPRIQQGLTRIINKLEYHIEHGIETKDL